MSCIATTELLTCISCRLHEFRTQVVAGHGDSNATIAGVGEAPGQQEDEHGVPFYPNAPAGRRLDMLLERVGLTRAQIWLDNVVHCQPPNNNLRAYPDAQAICPDLWLRPMLAGLPNLRVVVAFGATAGALWFPGHTATEMSKLARSCKEGYTVVGAFHPAYAVRSGEWVDVSIEASLRRAMSYAT